MTMMNNKDRFSSIIGQLKTRYGNLPSIKAMYHAHESRDQLFFATIYVQAKRNIDLKF